MLPSGKLHGVTRLSLVTIRAPDLFLPTEDVGRNDLRKYGTNLQPHAAREGWPQSETHPSPLAVPVYLTRKNVETTPDMFVGPLLRTAKGASHSKLTHN